MNSLSPEAVISLAEKGVYTTLMICGPLLLVALVVGLIVSVFQATTQIQEQTLAFIPKIIAVLVGLVFLDRGCFQRCSHIRMIFLVI